MDSMVVQQIVSELAVLRRRLERLEVQDGGGELTRSLIDAKGDLLAGTGADAVARLIVGANRALLVADSSQATGLRWAAGHDHIVLVRSDLTIASDAITVANSYHRLDTEGGAAADNLSTLNGGTTFQLLLLQSANSARDITVQHGVGNIYLNGSANFVLDNSRDMLLLIRTGAEWVEICRSNNS